MVAQTVIFGTKARVLCVLVAVILCTFSSGFGDTTVRFDTALGSFDVQLSDTATPLTVQNFLNYVNDGDYVNSFFHRLASGFVLQGGGFTYDGAFDYVPADTPVANEFNVSNTYGTIAMAKLGGDPNSATNQFFFNLADNSGSLDYDINNPNTNGGYTVFGEVVGDGMQVVELLASQKVWDASGTHSAFTDLPLINYDPQGDIPWPDTMEMINSITVVQTPEPATMAMLAVGGLTLLRRRKRKAA